MWGHVNRAIYATRVGSECNRRGRDGATASTVSLSMTAGASMSAIDSTRRRSCDARASEQCV